MLRSDSSPEQQQLRQGQKIRKTLPSRSFLPLPTAGQAEEQRRNLIQPRQREKRGKREKNPLHLLEFIGHFRGAGAEPCSEPAQTDIACEVFDLWQQRGQARTGGAAQQGLAAGTGALGQVHPDRCSVTLSLPARRGNPPRATGERGGICDSARG